MMRVLGLDLSLTATGWADANGGGVIKSRQRGAVRLREVRDEIVELVIAPRRVDVVILEGYSFGSKGSSLFQIGELGGVIRLALLEEEIPFAEVSPSALKKFATGKGNAPKDEVLAAAIRRAGFQGSNNNEADALWLYWMGVAHYDPRSALDLPQEHRKGLEKVEWPELAVSVS